MSEPVLTRSTRHTLTHTHEPEPGPELSLELGLSHTRSCNPKLPVQYSTVQDLQSVCKSIYCTVIPCFEHHMLFTLKAYSHTIASFCNQSRSMAHGREILEDVS